MDTDKKPVTNSEFKFLLILFKDACKLERELSAVYISSSNFDEQRILSSTLKTEDDIFFH